MEHCDWLSLGPPHQSQGHDKGVVCTIAFGARQAPGLVFRPVPLKAWSRSNEVPTLLDAGPRQDMSHQHVHQDGASSAEKILMSKRKSVRLNSVLSHVWLHMLERGLWKVR